MQPRFLGRYFDNSLTLFFLKVFSDYKGIYVSLLQDNTTAKII